MSFLKKFHVVIFLWVPLVVNYTHASIDLNLWSEGEVKKTIIHYVQKVTQIGSEAFIPPEDRIATFDNDGTLWVEKPLYAQLYFTFDRVKALAPKHPEWKSQQPFKAIIEDDQSELAQLREPDLVKLFSATYANVTQAEFVKDLSEWLKTAKNPYFGMHFPDLAYRPMVELLHYLRSYGFKTYIVSGGGSELMREFSQGTYGIPPEQVIGSSILMKFFETDGIVNFMRLPQIVEPINNKSGKPVNIQRVLGKVPVVAVGNSDGDLEMLQFADSSPYSTLKMVVHHDDSKREFEYDTGAEKVLNEARKKKWLVASMKKDFLDLFLNPSHQSNRKSALKAK